MSQLECAEPPEPPEPPEHDGTDSSETEEKCERLRGHLDDKAIKDLAVYTRHLVEPIYQNVLAAKGG